MWRKYAFGVLSAYLLLLFSACTSSGTNVRDEADRLNRSAYAARYRNLAQVELYADSAYTLSMASRYGSGCCEALVNKAFTALAFMYYEEADSLLLQAGEFASDNTSRLSVEVAYMRLCQRRSLNKEFFVHKFQAERLISRIHNNFKSLTHRQRQLYTSARCDYGIVLSAYLYYINRNEESDEAMRDIATDKDISIQSDTAQWLAYLYNVGGFENVMECYIQSERYGYLYWEANALQYLSEYLMDTANVRHEQRNNPALLRYLNDCGTPDTLLYADLASHALDRFVRYGDAYQTAAAWRTMADSYFRREDYLAMKNCLLLAVSDTRVLQAPNMVESINERLCVAYSALGDKYMADVSRNQYLDVQDSTRQDRQLDARADELHGRIVTLSAMLFAALVLLVVLGVTVFVLIRYRKRRGLSTRFAKLSDEIEELKEAISMLELQISDARRLNVEEHAKISLVQSMQPLVDRMNIAAKHSQSDEASKEYLRELCESISQGNDLLTKWIQLRRGNVRLKIETFPVQEIFDIIGINTVPFATKGITLDVVPTDISIKADKALTMFLINTVVDNARRYTPEGGTITVSCLPSDLEGYAEFCIADTGEGMPQEQADRLFEYKVIDNSAENLTEHKSHGFGLMNCRGIIDRYRKTSSLFSGAAISVKSAVGEGTKVLFRLPTVMKALLCLFVFAASVLFPADTLAKQGRNSQSQNELRANAYADSIYECNVAGRYASALEYADSCRMYINRIYHESHAGSTDTLSVTGESADMKWWERGVDVDYELVMALRNEVAVAALALHQWDLYSHNNAIYTRLYNASSADASLNDYCERMEHYEALDRLVLIVLLVLVACILVVFYVYYVRDVILAKNGLRDEINGLKERRQILAAEHGRLYVSNSIAENCLSTIKHETMYYPARIMQLISTGDDGVVETVSFYRSLYVLLSSHCQKLLKETPLATERITVGDWLAENRSKVSLECDINSLGGRQIIVNRELVDYMLLILKRKNKEIVELVDCSLMPDGKYIKFEFRCAGLSYSDEELSRLFYINTSDVDYLIIKQILREIGDQTLHYSAGINAYGKAGGTHFVVNVPTL